MKYLHQGCLSQYANWIQTTCVARKGSLSNGASKQLGYFAARKKAWRSVPNMKLDNVALLVYSFSF